LLFRTYLKESHIVGNYFMCKLMFHCHERFLLLFCVRSIIVKKEIKKFLRTFCLMSKWTEILVQVQVHFLGKKFKWKLKFEIICEHCHELYASNLEVSFVWNRGHWFHSKLQEISDLHIGFRFFLLKFPKLVSSN
jgi:uncharacterized protein VirK/YbjX